MSKRLLEDFAAAWGAKDIDAVMRLMTQDCIYKATVGPEPGATFRGQAQVRIGIEKMFAYDGGSTAELSNIVASGNFACWEWTYSWPDQVGKKPVRGCDLFELRDGLIHRKNAFRKTLT